MNPLSMDITQLAHLVEPFTPSPDPQGARDGGSFESHLKSEEPSPPPPPPPSPDPPQPRDTQRDPSPVQAPPDPPSETGAAEASCGQPAEDGSDRPDESNRCGTDATDDTKPRVRNTDAMIVEEERESDQQTVSCEDAILSVPANNVIAPNVEIRTEALPLQGVDSTSSTELLSIEAATDRQWPAEADVQAGEAGDTRVVAKLKSSLRPPHLATPATVEAREARTQSPGELPGETSSEQESVAQSNQPGTSTPRAEVRRNRAPRLAEQLPTVSAEAMDLAEQAPENASSGSAVPTSHEDRQDRAEAQRQASVPPPGDSEPSSPAPPRLAQHLIARSGGRSAQGAPLQGVEQSRFVERVARAFRFAESRDGVVRLRLSPPELGSVRLEIRLLGGGLAARFEAETPMAKSILVDNLPLLRDRLAEQGVRLEQFDVELTERHSGSPGEGFDRRDPRQPGHASPPSSGAAARQPVEEVPREDLVYRRRSGGQEQLDVVI